MVATEPRTARAGERWPTAVAVAGPGLLVLVGLISPIDDTDEPAERLADVFAHEGRYALTLLCLVGGLMLLVPAALAVSARAPSATRRLATVGAVVAACGFVLFVAASGALGFAPSAWATLPEQERAGLLPAFAAMDAGEGALGPVLVAPVLPVVGLGLLVAALWRHGSHPRAALIAVPVGWAVFLFAPTNLVKSLGALLLLGGLVTVLRSRPAS